MTVTVTLTVPVPVPLRMSVTVTVSVTVSGIMAVLVITTMGVAETAVVTMKVTVAGQG